MPSHCLHCGLQMMWYTLGHEPFQVFHILFLPIILVQVDFNLSYPKNGRGRYFLAKSYLHFSILKAYEILLFMVILDNDMPTSRRVFFTRLEVVKSGFPGRFVFFAQDVPNVSAISLSDGSLKQCFSCSLRMASFIWIKSKRIKCSFQIMQMSHLESTPDLLPA